MSTTKAKTKLVPFDTVVKVARALGVQLTAQPASA